MAASNSDLSEQSENVSDSDSDESIESLLRALRMSCRDLEKDFVDELKDCVLRPAIWTAA